ncbi:MAG TPA: aminotransferase class V-fold PLP-dependent enzyme [Beutenbergiaceae bacterium]|nr:aminotransferase class V-fold PLP-dependent enzyme [Beutenbergiaceae bacterium]
MTEALALWQRGQADYADWEAAMERCRGLFARTIGVDGLDVGLLPAVGPAISAAAGVLAGRSGTVVAHRREFRSLLLPVLARLGQDRIRWVDGPYVADTFTPAISGNTAGVLVSSVSSHDGGRPALAAITEAAGSVGAEVIVDATQEAGIVAPAVPVGELSVYATAAYKGLRAARGCGFAYTRPDLVEEFTAYSPYGMADAGQRGTYGPPVAPKAGAPALDQSPAWFSWVGAEPALREHLGSDAEAAAQHVLGMAARLRAGLQELGHQPQQTDLPSPVVTFAVDDPQAALARLAQRGIRAAAKGERIRLGFHVYNDDDDVDRVIAALTML